jgi:hypothetical protein
VDPDESRQHAILAGWSWFVPLTAIEALKEDRRMALQGEIDTAIDQLLDAIEATEPEIKEVATEEGARRITAAIFLLRATGLLREVRAAAEAPVLQVLGLRSTFELAIVGRYLVAHENGRDEFRRRYNASIADSKRLARFAGTIAPPPTDFLERLVEPKPKDPRNLHAIACDLDTLDGRPPGDEHSLQAYYRLVHNFVSSTASHASISSVKRYVRRDEGELSVESAPDPIFSGPPVLSIAAVLADLARDVFPALGLPTEGIPMEITRPRRGGATVDGEVG